MASSYSGTNDPLRFQNPSHRAIAPARDGYLVAPAATNLPVYGKPRVVNTNSAVATIVVVPVAAQDDSDTITLTYPPNSVATEQMVVRQIVHADSGVIVHVFV